MGTVTLTRGGRVVDASPQAADALRRQGWTEVSVPMAARPVAAIKNIKAKTKRQSKKDK